MIKDSKPKNIEQEYEFPVASREELLSVIETSNIPPTFKALCKKLNYQRDEHIVGLKRRLRAMENEGQLIFNKFKQYAIPPKNSLLIGKVCGHRDGYGFFTPDQPVEATKGKDLFISSHEMQRVIHGDIVEAMIVDRTDRKGRQEVKIIDVIEPRKHGIVGRFFVEHNILFVVPEDTRIKQDILIDPKERSTARHGQMVVVDIIQRPSKRSNAVGKVSEVLGDYMAPGMEIDIALRAHDLPHEFPSSVLEQVNQINDEVDEPAKANRKDLRKLPLVTIDGEDARDFDDAVYCQKEPTGGWRLWVAIADVSYYVRPGSALDDEAIARGNSVYFPSQVIPMLPEKLSNGLCSLNPDVDRLAMVCEMTINTEGELAESTFYPAVIKSHARFTYTKVAAILNDDQELREQYADRVPELETLNQLYLALKIAREKRGAIAFETQETRFVFNEHRKIESIEPLLRNDAHKIIEECMILANVATANFVLAHQKPGLYRVHDKPNDEKFTHFVNYLAELGITMPLKGAMEDGPEPADYSAILATIEGRPEQELIQTMLLRSMKQAVYQHDNIGHFGLALASYSHFTSPIRRYPDLVIHRVIKAILQSQSASEANEGHHLYEQQQIAELGEHCSMTERRADDATRDVADWLKCEFMQDHVGDVFTGVISTVTNFGLFVRLHNIHIEGLVHITSLGHDFYHFDDARMCLTGDKTGNSFHVGDELEVQIAAVNLEEKKIDLVLVDTLNKVAKKPVKTAATKTRKRKLQKNVDKQNSPATSKKQSKASQKKNNNNKKSRPGKNARKKTKG
ncbi:ribonuclease R [Thalassotalea hakodatensis]|uniref:ribonuclease R n=1 Tax=Thalassotalea hakodatensis TaxID=3030492 RepID=UPI00257284E1|nr:ribonuclease R [Thalassotalea hakodatensis]